MSELPTDMSEYIECIMDDCIIFMPDIKTHKNKVLKCFLYKIKEHGLLLTIHKTHTFCSKVKYMGLILWSSDGLPTITPLGPRVKVVSTLSIPITACGVKSFIGCFIYLAKFQPKLSTLIKPINDILKKSNKVHKLEKLKPLAQYGKGKGIRYQKSPNIQDLWTQEHSDHFEASKKIIEQVPVLPIGMVNSSLKVILVLNMLVQFCIKPSMA